MALTELSRSISGKVAVVTGAANGMGDAMANQLRMRPWSGGSSTSIDRRSSSFGTEGGIRMLGARQGLLAEALAL